MKKQASPYTRGLTGYNTKTLYLSFCVHVHVVLGMELGELAYNREVL